MREINSTAAISDSAGAQSLPHRACEVREIISSAEDEARHLYNLRALYPQPKKTIADHEGTVVTIAHVFGSRASGFGLKGATRSCFPYLRSERRNSFSEFSIARTTSASSVRRLQNGSPLTTLPYSNGFFTLRNLRYAVCVMRAEILINSDYGSQLAPT